MNAQVIAAKLNRLPPARVAEVLDFIDFLHQREFANEPQTALHGLTHAEAAGLRQSLTTFTDWDNPSMDSYDDYDNQKAALDA